MVCRKELLEELNVAQSNIDIRLPDNTEIEEGEISSNSICESQTICSKEEDVKSTNTSYLTFISEESDGRISRKRNKKKLKVVTDLEQKILKTPVKKYPEEKSKKQKNVNSNKGKGETLETEVDTDKKLFLLFDDFGDAKTKKFDTRSDKTKKTPKKVKTETNKKSIENTVIKPKIDLARDNPEIANGGKEKNLIKREAPKSVCEKIVEQRPNYRMLLDAMIPSLDDIHREVKNKIGDSSKESFASTLTDKLKTDNVNILDQNYPLKFQEKIREKQNYMDEGKY